MCSLTPWEPMARICWVLGALLRAALQATALEDLWPLQERELTPPAVGEEVDDVYVI